MYQSETKQNNVKRISKARVIVLHGIIGWGIPTALLVFFFTRMVDHGFRFTNYFNGDWQRDLVIYLIIFPLGGILYGWWMWRTMKK